MATQIYSDHIKELVERSPQRTSAWIYMTVLTPII